MVLDSTHGHRTRSEKNRCTEKMSESRNFRSKILLQIAAWLSRIFRPCHKSFIVRHDKTALLSHSLAKLCFARFELNQNRGFILNSSGPSVGGRSTLMRSSLSGISLFCGFGFWNAPSGDSARVRNWIKNSPMNLDCNSNISSSNPPSEFRCPSISR